MLASQNNIVQFIPQREPMVMISGLVEASDLHAVTVLKIENGNVFVEGDVLTEPGLVENIAQTAAAHIGYQCHLKNVPVPIGYIAAVRNLKISKLPKVDSNIRTSVKIVNQVLDVTLAEGSVEYENEVCCSCEMRIFVKNN